MVEANHLLRKGDVYATHNLTDKDKEEIRRLSKDPRIAQRIVKSIAPSITATTTSRRARASLLGGQEKIVKGKTRLRGTSTCLPSVIPAWRRASS